MIGVAPPGNAEAGIVGPGFRVFRLTDATEPSRAENQSVPASGPPQLDLVPAPPAPPSVGGKGETAMDGVPVAHGLPLSGMVAVTPLLDGSITVTDCPPVLATKILPLFGPMATELGLNPAAMVATTVLL